MKKLKEGAGAGYSLYIENLRSNKVQYSKPKVENGDLIVSVIGTIVPDNYCFKAEGYDWATEDGEISQMTGKLYGTVSLIDYIDSDLTVVGEGYEEARKLYMDTESDGEEFDRYSGFLNSFLKGEQTEWFESFKEVINSEFQYISIKSSFSLGWCWCPAEDPMEFRNEDHSDIQYYEKEHYGDVIITSALIESEGMCDYINEAHDNDSIDTPGIEDYEDYEEYINDPSSIDDEDIPMDESKKSNKKSLREDMSPDGTMLYVYSSSKDTDLFKYYFSNTLEHGLNASSAYGLGTYAVMEPPFNNASIGYDAEKRDQIYGDNCFKFRIPTNKIFFLNWSDFQLTPLCKSLEATRDNFIEKQLDYFQIDPMVKRHIEELIPRFEDSPIPDDWDDDRKAKWADYLQTKATPDVGNSKQAQALYRLMSRYYYQNKRGSLRTPIAGFCYTGAKDGRTYVGWNAKAMIPEAFTNDLGETWQECDRTSPEYQEYVAKAEGWKFDPNNDTDANRIFDGNRTPEKEGVYRLFMKFNSGDDTSDAMSGGVFQNIVIHDDKTVDCKFKSNLTQYDLGKRCFSIDNNLIRSLNEIGYRFGVLDASLRFGHESKKIGQQRSLLAVKPEGWPKACTGGLRLAGQPINKETMGSIPTEFGEKSLLLIRCEIQEDVFDNWDTVQFKEIDKKDKQCWTPNEDVWNALRAKYDWMDQVAKEPLEGPYSSMVDRSKAKLTKVTGELEAAKQAKADADAAGDAKAITKAQKALDKAQKAVDDTNVALAGHIAKAKIAKDKEDAEWASINNSWAHHVDRIKNGWKKEEESMVNRFFKECDGACAGGDCGAATTGAQTAGSIAGFIPENPLVKKHGLAEAHYDPADYWNEDPNWDIPPAGAKMVDCDRELCRRHYNARMHKSNNYQAHNNGPYIREPPKYWSEEQKTEYYNTEYAKIEKAAARKSFWTDAKANTINIDAFHQAYDDELKDKFDFSTLFNDSGFLSSKGTYGQIKNACTADPDSWALKSLKKLWALQFAKKESTSLKNFDLDEFSESTMKGYMEDAIDEIIADAACNDEVWARVMSEFDDAGVNYLEEIGFPHED